MAYGMLDASGFLGAEGPVGVAFIEGNDERGELSPEEGSVGVDAEEQGEKEDGKHDGREHWKLGDALRMQVL